MKNMYEFKEEISQVNERLQEYDRTVIMAPCLGNPKKPETKLRVYSYGAGILKLTTQGSQKCNSNKSYFTEEQYKGEIDYTQLDETYWKIALENAKKWADGTRNKHHQEERSLETYLIRKNRQNQTRAVILDMEFTLPNEWMGKTAHMRNGEISKTGEVDLIVYDKTKNSFGLVELKYHNKSTNNMEKHFVDYTNILESPHIDDLRKEFIRKAKYLIHYHLIDDFQTAQMHDARFWGAFLFVDGVEKECKDTFNNTKVHEDSVQKKLFGFRFVKYEDADMPFTEDWFFDRQEERLK